MKLLNVEARLGFLEANGSRPSHRWCSAGVLAARNGWLVADTSGSRRAITRSGWILGVQML